MPKQNQYISLKYFTTTIRGYKALRRKKSKIVSEKLMELEIFLIGLEVMNHLKTMAIECLLGSLKVFGKS